MVVFRTCTKRGIAQLKCREINLVGLGELLKFHGEDAYIPELMPNGLFVHLNEGSPVGLIVFRSGKVTVTGNYSEKKVQDFLDFLDSLVEEAIVVKA